MICNLSGRRFPVDLLPFVTISTTPARSEALGAGGLQTGWKGLRESVSLALCSCRPCPALLDVVVGAQRPSAVILVLAGESRCRNNDRCACAVAAIEVDSCTDPGWGLDLLQANVLVPFFGQNPTCRCLLRWRYKIVRCWGDGKSSALWINLWVNVG